MVDLHPGGQLLITDDELTSHSYKWNIEILPSISLSDAGQELTLVSSDGDILDKITYTDSYGLRSRYGQPASVWPKREFVDLGAHSLLPDELNECLIWFRQIKEDGESVLQAYIQWVSPDWCGNQYDHRRQVRDEVVGEGACTIRLPDLWGGMHEIDFEIWSDKLICQATAAVYIPANRSYENIWWVDTGESNDELSIQITEIYPDDRLYGEYIELTVSWSYEWEILIEWLGHGSASKEVLLEWEQGIILITESLTWLSPSISYKLLPSLSLTNGGEELRVVWQSWQLIDTVVYSWESPSGSWYRSTISGATTLTGGPPTPGYDIALYEQIRVQNKCEENIQCWIELQHLDWLVASNAINMIALVDGQEIKNSNSTYRCHRTMNEADSSTFTGCNPGYIRYTTWGLYEVELEVTTTDGRVCTTSLPLNLPSGSTKTGGWWSCKEDYYEGLYRKRKERFQTAKKEIRKVWYKLSTTGLVLPLSIGGSLDQLPVATWQVGIVSVLPNPAGRDTNRERILIKNNTSEIVDSASWYLFNGTSNRWLSEVVIPGGATHLFSGSRWLTNRPTCLTLHDKQYIYDRFCYPKAADDQRFDTSYTGMEEQQLDMTYRGYKVSISDTEACLEIDWSSIVCEELPYTGGQVAIRKEEVKKRKNLGKELEKAKKYQSRYEKEKSRSQGYRKSIRALKEEKYRESARRQLAEAYVWHHLEKFKADWYTLYQHDGYDQDYELYRQLREHLLGGNDTYSIAGVSLETDEYEAIHGMVTLRRLPLEKIDIRDLTVGLSNSIKQLVDTLDENLTTQAGRPQNTGFVSLSPQ